MEGFRALFVMNHEVGGFDCPACAWPDDPSALELDLCENRVKHTTWEVALAEADRAFFADPPWLNWPAGATMTSKR